jgi:hypothetical protein
MIVFAINFPFGVGYLFFIVKKSLFFSFLLFIFLVPAAFAEEPYEPVSDADEIQPGETLEELYEEAVEILEEMPGDPTAEFLMEEGMEEEAAEEPEEPADEPEPNPSGDPEEGDTGDQCEGDENNNTCTRVQTTSTSRITTTISLSTNMNETVRTVTVLVEKNVAGAWSFEFKTIETVTKNQGDTVLADGRISSGGRTEIYREEYRNPANPGDLTYWKREERTQSHITSAPDANGNTQVVETDESYTWSDIDTALNGRRVNVYNDSDGIKTQTTNIWTNGVRTETIRRDANGDGVWD